MTASHAFLGYGITEPPSLADLEALSTAQAHAARALGQLDAALAWCPPDMHPILASRLIRETLISALRQEGHLFTDARFHAWFAGLVVNGQRTLHPTPHANSPDRQNSLHRRYFLTPFNIRAAALDDGASLRP